MLQLSAGEFQGIRNSIQDKQFFLVVNESSLSGIQYFNILVGCLVYKMGKLVISSRIIQKKLPEVKAIVESFEECSF